MKHPECPFTDEQIMRFFNQVVEGENGCRVWIGVCNHAGYGQVTINRKPMAAHRVAYVIANGSIPAGMVIRHKCDNPPCVHFEHLETGTHKQNSQDMVKRGRCNPPRGERAWNHRLTREIVIQIKRDIIAGTLTQLELSRKYGVNKNTINSIRLGLSWANVPPFIPKEIPKPHRVYSDQDYLDIRQLWRDGWTYKQIAAKYECRPDVIQAIVYGKRGTGVPVGERVYRRNKRKLSDAELIALYKRYLSGECQCDLRKEVGVSKNGICLMFKRAKALLLPLAA